MVSKSMSKIVLFSYTKRIQDDEISRDESCLDSIDDISILGCYVNNMCKYLAHLRQAWRSKRVQMLALRHQKLSAHQTPNQKWPWYGL